MSNSPTLRLPTGMRDFAPRAAAARRRIAETLLEVFERWGFARVITPAFEYEETLALGLGGAVVRLERAGKGQRELIQAGVELAGVAGPAGDVEVIALGVAALRAAGLPRPTIDLAHLGLAREVLSSLGLPEP